MTDVASPQADAAPLAAPAIVSAPANTQEPLTPSEAARLMAQARWSKPAESQEAPEPAAPANELADEANAAQQDNADPGTTDDASTPEPEEALPPIEPPRSWTKEAKERWSTYPREAQEEFARIEQAREREFRRGQNEAAELRRAAQAQLEQVEQARKHYESQLPILMQTLQDAQAGAFSDIKSAEDYTRLASEDPFRFLQFQAHQAKVQAVNAELERVRAEQERMSQSQWAEHIAKENEKAIDLIPDLADKAKAEKLTSRVANELLPELGFAQEELAALASGKQKLSIYDARIQRLLFDSIRLADIQKAKVAAATKPVPTVQRPGVASAKSAADDASIQALEQQLNNSGRLDDAFRLFQARKALSR